MPASSKNISPPSVSMTASLDKKVSAAISKSKPRKSQRSDEVAEKLAISKKRCLAAAKIIERRLEILALLDYKPLFSGRNSTTAGDLFEARVTERNMDLESLLAIIESSTGDDTTVLNKYNSVVVATQSDFAILKMLILLREYATHTARFLDFINEYQLHEDLDISWLGDENSDLLSSICRVEFERGPANQPVGATEILIQLLLIINCSTYGISPYHMTTSKKSLPRNKVITNFNITLNKDYIADAYDLAFISRDLTFSQEMTKLKNNESPDEILKELIDNSLGNSFITSPLEQNTNIMRQFVGSSSFSNLRTSKENQDELKHDFIADILNNKKGVISRLLRGLTSKSSPDILLPESGVSKYQKEYSDIDPIVDKAFSGEKILDFDRYEKVIDDLINDLSDTATFGKKAFRLLDEKSNSAGKFREDIPIVAEEQPLSMPSISAVVLDVFNRRFASTLKTSLYNKFYDWKTPEHVSYTKIQAWLLIRDNPELAKKIVRSVIKDHEDGFLTVASQPEPIEGSAELDSDGNEIEGTEEMSDLVYVKPGTSTMVNLTGKGPRLGSAIRKINSYYADDVSQMSPSNVLSSNYGEGVSWPPIRVQYERIGSDVRDYFGSSNHQQTDPDLRLINVMTVYRERWDFSTQTSSTNNYYCGTKIIAAEIIDTVLEICRAMVTPFAEVEMPSDGDPVFPFVEDMKSPYGNGHWGYSADGYDQFQMNLWVSTITGWNKLFTRSTDKKTYFRRRSIRTHSDKIIDILGRLMLPYDFMKVRTETITDGIKITEWKNVNPADFSFKIWPVCATIKCSPSDLIAAGSWKADGDTTLADYMKGISSTIDDLLNSSFDDLDDIQPVTVSSQATAVSGPGGSHSAGSSLPGSGGGGSLYTADVEPAEIDIDTSLAVISGNYRTFLSVAKHENTILSFLYDFIGKYGERIGNYKDATINLINDESSPIGDLVTTLLDLGPAGEDILQNLSTNQLALKQIALEEEQGVKENGYLPNLSIISEKEANCVRLLCSEEITRSPEGDTTKIIMVGIPISTFDKKKINDKFGLRLSYRDIEYPQLVFASKTFMFDKDLYILPDDLESTKTTSSFSKIAKQAKYSKIRVEVVESTDETATIEIIDDIQKIKYDSSDPDVFINLLISETLKIYYRLMLGLNFSETAFLSTPEGAKIPISDTSSSLAKSMSASVESISTFSEGLASNLDALLGDITKFDNIDDFVSGDITPVDEALIVDLKNAFQSRIFSPEVLRSRVLSAKMFDRIYAIPVDPDEFYIVPPGEAEVGNVETPAQIFDFYLNAGIIEETGLDSPRKYKLAPRKSAEGSMAFGNITVSMVTASEDGERIFSL